MSYPEELYGCDGLCEICPEKYECPDSPFCGPEDFDPDNEDGEWMEDYSQG